LAAELLKHYEPEIEKVTLIPSQGGVFEVTVNRELAFSKLATGRFPNAGEVNDLVKQILRKGR